MVERSAAQQSTPLPRPATPTVGRARDIERILDLLGRARIVTLLGPGGMGKTRLAAEAAVERVAVTSTEAYFVDLTQVRDAQLVPELIVRELVSRQARRRMQLELRGGTAVASCSHYDVS